MTDTSRLPVRGIHAEPRGSFKRMLRDLTSWVLSDGKAGDELQCLGVTDALGLTPEVRRIRPRAPWSWLMPYGPIDPAERPGVPGSPLAPPFPDLLVASGRRAVAYLPAVKRASGGRTFTVYLKDPRTRTSVADLIWAPAYDRLEGPNVFVTLTSPHRVSAARLADARERPDARLAGLPVPRVAVLAGGDSRHHRYTEADISRFARGLAEVAGTGAGLMITASRRTPPDLRLALLDLAARSRGFMWDGTGENPYVAMLALADFVVVTADSANMVGEAAATGAPVLVFEPSGGHPKHKLFLAGLEAKGVVHAFQGRLEGRRYEPLNSTPAIAEAVAAGLARHRRTLALPDRGPLYPET